MYLYVKINLNLMFTHSTLPHRTSAVFSLQSVLWVVTDKKFYSGNSSGLPERCPFESVFRFIHWVHLGH